jgi:hypothetical protein
MNDVQLILTHALCQIIIIIIITEPTIYIYLLGAG